MSTEEFRKVHRIAVTGLGVEVGDYGVKTISDSATQIDLVTAMKNILAAENGMSVRSRFMVGDLYNHITKDRAARKVLMSMFENVLGKNTAQRLRTYGWVANKWPIESRSDKHPWFWWLSNKLGQEPVERTPNPTEIEFLREEMIGSRTYQYYKSSTGRLFVVKGPEPADYPCRLPAYVHEESPEYTT